MPLTDLSKVEFTDKESGEVKIKYMKGAPRQYRFDASKGFFNIKGETRLTKNGESLTIIPLAYQIFVDDILGDQYGKMRWLELIFLNEQLQVCSMLLHGYSVENFMRNADELFYDNANFRQVKLTIKPVEKTSTNPNAKGAKYWMAFFDYKVLDKAVFEKLETATKGLEFFRRDTYTINRAIQLSENYGIPTEIAERLAEMATAKKELAEKAADTETAAAATA